MSASVTFQDGRKLFIHLTGYLVSTGVDESNRVSSETGTTGSDKDYALLENRPLNK
jgi:hypothetical protein